MAIVMMDDHHMHYTTEEEVRLIWGVTQMSETKFGPHNVKVGDVVVRTGNERQCRVVSVTNEGITAYPLVTTSATLVSFWPWAIVGQLVKPPTPKAVPGRWYAWHNNSDYRYIGLETGDVYGLSGKQIVPFEPSVMLKMPT